MERAEAEAILDGDRETAVGLLLRLDELVEANQRLVDANERLEARVAELERRLNRSSRNSSLPPSQDPPSAPPRPRGKGSGRKRGGQHGHEGRYRRLLPPGQVDEIVEHWPDRCGSCAHGFAEADRVDAAEPSRRQAAELPPIAVRVTEHRLHRVCCPECAAVTAAEPPAGSRWAFGPRLQAAVVTLAVRNRVSRRDATELARELFGVEISTGTVDAIVQRAGEALAAPHTRLEQEIKRSPVVNIDETGWKTGGERRMLWGALSRRTAVFRIAAGRHAAEAQTMLGERYEGIVCSDRWAAYDYLDPNASRPDAVAPTADPGTAAATSSVSFGSAAARARPREPRAARSPRPAHPPATTTKQPSHDRRQGSPRPQPAPHHTIRRQHRGPFTGVNAYTNFRICRTNVQWAELPP